MSKFIKFGLQNIAAGLSPLNLELMARQSGRLMLARMNEPADAGVDFVFNAELQREIDVTNQ